MVMPAPAVRLLIGCVGDAEVLQEIAITDEGPMMTGAATVLVVTDMAKSMAYYRDVLGFEVTFEYGQR